VKILLTGASSFTGYWFANALVAAGHHVVAPLRGSALTNAAGLRDERVRRLSGIAEVVESCAFGSEPFMDLVRAGGYDLLCHHAAQVKDYRSADFDIAGAVADNTANLRAILAALAAGGLKGVVVTGSVFEQDEGAGNPPLVAFSPYGLSKGLTAALVSYRCAEIGMPCGKFVIPNPFGPLEEPRFCNYLIRTWRKGEVARVNTPAYIRDNIHVGLLAAAYARFATEIAGGRRDAKLNPSGYVGSQGDFAERFATAMRPRLRLACDLELGVQTDFAEPIMRVNTQSAALYVGSWDDDKAWDSVAEAAA
jgi:nucleoside-diphosphate-sugar epimerase